MRPSEELNQLNTGDTGVTWDPNAAWQRLDNMLRPPVREKHILLRMPVATAAAALLILFCTALLLMPRAKRPAQQLARSSGPLQRHSIGTAVPAPPPAVIAATEIRTSKKKAVKKRPAPDLALNCYLHPERSPIYASSGDRYRIHEMLQLGKASSGYYPMQPEPDKSGRHYGYKTIDTIPMMDDVSYIHLHNL